MSIVQAKISSSVKQELTHLVELGVFKDESEAVNVAVKKMLANQSREYLRDLAKRKNITKKELLAEWEKTRN